MRCIAIDLLESRHKPGVDAQGVLAHRHDISEAAAAACERAVAPPRRRLQLVDAPGHLVARHAAGAAAIVCEAVGDAARVGVHCSTALVAAKR